MSIGIFNLFNWSFCSIFTSSIFPFQAFNAVVRLCIMDLIPAVKRFLKCSSEDQKLNLERCKSWVKVRTHVKSYLADVIRVSKKKLI